MGNTTSAFDVEKSCRVNNDSFSISDCLPKFNYDSTNKIVGVSTLGGVRPGDLNTDPDIAGIGVLLAFLIPSGIALGIGAILSIRPIHGHLPERLQVKFINTIAPARPARDIVEYQRPTFMRRPHREPHPDLGYKTSNRPYTELGHPAHQSSSVPLPYPISQSYHIQSPFATPNEHHSQPQNPYNSENTTTPSDQIETGKAISGSDDSPFSETFYEMLQAALQAITDSQILLSLAFIFNFFVNGKCDMSLYHFRLGINIIEIACANAFLSLLLVRGYWKAPVSAFTRLITLGLSMYMLYRLLELQQDRGYTAERLPPLERNNSLILLKASCFLDKDLVVFSNSSNAASTNNTNLFSTTVITNETNNSVTLTNDEFNVIGHLDYGKYQYERLALYALMANFVVIGFYAFLGALFRKYIPNSVRGWLFSVYAFATWALCLVILSTNASYIFDLRRWVNNSGWFGAETENYVGLGQWAALMAMGGIFFAFFDQLKLLGP